MSRERALLRRLVEWVDELPRKVAWTGEQTLRDFVIPATGIAEDARALLAEPEGVVEKMPPVERLITRLCAKDYNGFEERKADVRKVVAEFLASYRPTPRSRAEAEAMVEALSQAIDARHRWLWNPESGSGDTEDVRTLAEYRNARAALLAALCGEGT